MSLKMLSDLYESVDPTLKYPVNFCIATTATVYVLSIITGNVSQVDRVWTFLPTIYTAYFALMPLWPDHAKLYLGPYTPKEVPYFVKDEYSPRALLMLALVFLWMCRLSYNTWRRGLFNPNDEDYRWAVLREKVPTWLFQLTNLTFIAIIQNIILFLLGIPTRTAALQPHTPLAASDYTLAALAVITLATEFTADNQQYSFQTFKHGGVQLSANDWPGARLRWSGADAKRGFVTRGLWAWTRHPNFFCEQTFWILITLFPILAPGPPSLPTPLTSVTTLYPLAPCLVLCTLFFSSTLFSESISLSKYPEEYAMYQSRVAMFVPVFTPIWGLWAAVRGRKGAFDQALWGRSKAE
ncbi:DUF1295-domain-containing protein [Athelia psychrophila]|uniref:DUF1295-domain-containing protein n=1 Tax=Athelia psychrophila TaxID=1759441 RepID=A0A166QQM8_9AGAM|nr:DUF1295-domain-containing protein [Fibularhizoctonia sp. CBS 109695]